jgi:serine/threonine-protein kinase
MLLTNGTTFAGFTVLRQIGSGGMGEVYLVRHPRLARNDAVKVLPQGLAQDPDYRRRFEREADAAAALWHPHIVGVHDRGEYDGQLWISMDYVEGTDAGKLLRERFPTGMPRSEAAAIVSAVAEALDYAHSRGLLHRDVKPANVLLTDSPSGPRRILLADFGIARQLDETSGLTVTNMTVGTISYAAPEQLTDGPIDGRADQYALAATAFHLLTGAAPYAHSNPAVVISRRLSAPPPRVADTRPDLADVDGVLSRALALDPRDRFANCSDFAAALRGEMVAPTPPRGVAESAAPTMLASTPSSPATPSWSPPAAPQPPSSRISPLVLALGVLAVILTVAVVLVGVLLGRGWGQPAAAPLQAPATTSALTGASVAPPVTISVAPPTVTAPPLAPTTAQMVLSDADAHGFVSLGGGARCEGGDLAELIVRTAQSAFVVCKSDTGGAYYRGYRLSDGARLELSTVVAEDTKLVAINPSDGTRYELSTNGLQIVQNGQVVSNEPAVESAS